MPDGERYRLCVGNLLAAMGVAISLGYSLLYLPVLDSVSAFVMNLICTMGYLSYFAVVRAGHVAGDQTLVEVANTMRQIMRLGDQLGRFGGEEFVALLPQTDSVAARSVAEKLRERIASLNVVLPAGLAIRFTA